MTAPETIRLEKVSKRFGPFPALEGIDLTIGPGAFVLLAGANGAGKTTLLHLIAGLSKPTVGRVQIGGADPGRRPEPRAKVGLLSHQVLLYGDMSARQNLLFFARLYRLERAAEQVDQALEHVGLAPRQHHRVATFSRGMKQRLALARACLHRPSILLLDEPHTGLDRGAARMLDRLLHRLKGEGGTAVLVTHRMEEAAELADHLVLLRRGRIRHNSPWRGDLAQLEALYAGEASA